MSFDLHGREEHAYDIAVYLESALKIDHEPLALRLRKEIQRRASGVFVWVVLVIAILNREYDHGHVHRLNETLERIPDELNDLFHDILTRETNDVDNTIRCIQWLLFSAEPLYPIELCCAMLIGNSPQAFTNTDISSVTRFDVERYILSCSKSLMETTWHTKSTRPRVQFIHETVVEYLAHVPAMKIISSDDEEDFEGQSHERLKMYCLDYLHIADREGASFALDQDVRSQICISRGREICTSVSAHRSA